MKRLLLILFMTVVQAAAWADLTAPASKAGLKPADVAKLHSTKCKIAIPTYIPQGFHLEKVEVTLDQRFGNSYSLRYKGPGKQNFAVEMANGGIGDAPSGDKEYPFTNPLFGKGTLQWWGPTQDHPQPYVLADWLSEKPGKMPVYHLLGDEFDPQEAVKVLQSLRYLQ